MTASRSVSSVVLSRYAGALIDLAQQSNSLDKVLSDLRSLAAMVEGSSDLAAMIRSPMIGKAKQIAALSEIAAKAKFQTITFNFLGVLAENRRLNLLVDVIAAVERIVAERSGRAPVAVTTAVALSDAQKKELQTKLASSLGHDVTLEVKVDPSILGGMIVTIGSKMIDDSVRRKLERLQGALTRRASNNPVQTIKEVV